MIAVILADNDRKIKLVDDTPENRDLLSKAASEVGTQGPWPASDKVDKMLKKVKVRPGVYTECSSCFVHYTDW